MEESVAIVALVAGSLAILGSVAGAFVSFVAMKARALRTRKSPHALELSIDGNKYVIDVSSIDREDPKNIDAAIKAVKAAGPMEAAA